MNNSSAELDNEFGLAQTGLTHYGMDGQALGLGGISQSDYEKEESSGCGKWNTNRDDDGLLVDASWI